MAKSSAQNFHLVVTITCLSLLACGRTNEVQISASATATNSLDCPVQLSAMTEKEHAALENMVEKMRSIDARFPGSKTPRNLTSETVSNVVTPGVITFDSGREVTMDGLRCDSVAVSYLRRMLMDENVSVITITSSSKSGNISPAEIWSADVTLELKGLATTAAFSNVSETSIKSGWCHVEQNSTLNHNGRYAAIEKAFRSAPSADTSQP